MNLSVKEHFKKALSTFGNNVILIVPDIIAFVVMMVAVIIIIITFIASAGAFNSGGEFSKFGLLLFMVPIAIIFIFVMMVLHQSGTLSMFEEVSSTGKTKLSTYFKGLTKYFGKISVAFLIFGVISAIVILPLTFILMGVTSFSALTSVSDDPTFMMGPSAFIMNVIGLFFTAFFIYWLPIVALKQFSGLKSIIESFKFAKSQYKLSLLTAAIEQSPNLLVSMIGAVIMLPMLFSDNSIASMAGITVINGLNTIAGLVTFVLIKIVLIMRFNIYKEYHSMPLEVAVATTNVSAPRVETTNIDLKKPTEPTSENASTNFLQKESVTTINHNDDDEFDDDFSDL